jgi:hypothetical protein
MIYDVIHDIYVISIIFIGFVILIIRPYYFLRICFFFIALITVITGSMGILEIVRNTCGNFIIC